MPIQMLAKDLQPELVCWRRWCHQHPELGFAEEKTAAYIAERLASWGLEVEKGVGKTGVVGLVRGAARRRRF